MKKIIFSGLTSVPMDLFHRADELGTGSSANIRLFFFSCEGSARICGKMNIKISGDTIIRPLTGRHQMQEVPVCGEVIGVDDLAFKKRHRYGTIIIIGKSSRLTNLFSTVPPENPGPLIIIGMWMMFSKLLRL